jgi:hypothetical protein
MKESWVEKLLLGIFIIIIAWACTSIYQYYSNRSKIESVILLDINMYSQKIKEFQDFCNIYFKKKLKKDNKINYLMRYSKDNFDTYNLMFPEIIEYCSKGHITKIMKFYNALVEYNFLMKGLCKELVYYKKNGIVLGVGDLTHLKNMNDRINKIVKIITQRKYESINDLPNDYSEIIPSK